MFHVSETSSADAAVTQTASSMSPDVSWCPLLGQCVNARQCRSAVRKLLHDDNKSACIDDDVSFCNMFVNFFVSKIDSLKSTIASQLIHIETPPPDHVCSYLSLQRTC